MNNDIESINAQMPVKNEKKHQLYMKQKELLDTFLEHGTITRAQYEKSLHDLTEKMGEG